MPLSSLKRRILLNPSLTRRWGLGDAIASIATPVARAMGLDCIDPATHQLRDASRCAENRRLLNAAAPNLNPLAKSGPDTVP